MYLKFEQKIIFLITYPVAIQEIFELRKIHLGQLSNIFRSENYTSLSNKTGNVKHTHLVHSSLEYQINRLCKLK